MLPCLQHPPVHLSIKVACIRIGVGLSKENDNPQFISFAVKTLPEAISETTEPIQLWTLTEALKTVLGELGSAEAQKIFAQLITLMERITEPNQDMALIGTLRAVPGTLDPQQLISLLKWPTSVGARRSTLLSLLEEQTGQNFDNNLWKMVTWAQANGLDVKSPPKRPDK